MMHIRGHASDYDNWAYNGCPGLDATPSASRTSRSSRIRKTTPTRPAGKGGPIPRHQRRAARPEPDVAGVHRRVPRARLPGDRRLQRPEHGGRRLAPHQRQGRQAPRARRRATSSRPRGARTSPSRTHSQATRLISRRRPLRRRRVRPGRRGVEAQRDRARSSSALARSSRRSCCWSPASARSSTCEPFGIDGARSTCRASARTSTTTC